MKVTEIMTTPIVTVRQDTTLDEVARIMLERKIGGVAVVREDGEIAGIISQSDFSATDRPVPFSLLQLPSVFGHWLQPPIERVYQEARTMTAAEIMTRHVVTVREDDPVEEAIRQMCEAHVHRLPVMRGKVPVGIITRQDLLRLMLSGGTSEAARVSPAGKETTGSR